MSTLSSVSNSAGVNYATQLAQTSALERSFSNLGTAIQSGNLTSAGSILTALIQANPQYATTTSSGGTQSQDPINQDFDNLASAISSNQVDAVKTAWTQLKTDLSNAGVSTNTSASDLASQAVAKSNDSMDQTILSALLGNDSNTGSLVVTLIGAGSNSSDPVGSLVTNWLTYESNGSVANPAGPNETGSSLNTVA